MIRETNIQRGGGLIKKALAASLLAAAIALPALVGPASAADSVQRGRSIEAFIGTNLVDIQGYPANKSVKVEVLRNGVLVGSVVGRTDADGYIEFNHVGGGPVSAGGDCFQNPVSPDVMPGDVIRTQVAGESIRDRAVVRDIFLDTEATQVVGNEIHVFGHVRGTASGPINTGADILDLRLNANGFTWESGDRPGRGDLREGVTAADFSRDADGDPTTFEHVFNLDPTSNDASEAAGNNFEQAFEWSRDGAAVPPALFVSDAEAGGLPGCPPFADHAVTGKSVAAINKANIAGGLTFSGISSGAEAVTVTLSDGNAATVDLELPATIKAAYTAPHQTWRTSAMSADQVRVLKLMDDGRLTASIGQGPVLRVTKDTVAPAKVVAAAPRPGTYNRTQLVTLEASPGNEIRYTLNGSRPSATSNLFSRSIRVARTTTIKAVAVDKAGNLGPVGSYRYVIR